MFSVSAYRGYRPVSFFFTPRDVFVYLFSPKNHFWFVAMEVNSPRLSPPLKVNKR